MFRLTIGKAPSYGPGEIQPVAFQLGDEVDPFAGEAPAAAPTGTAIEPAPSAAPAAGFSLGDEVDPFADGPDLAPAPAQTRPPGRDDMLAGLTGTTPPTFDVGGGAWGQGQGQPDATALPQPGAPAIQPDVETWRLDGQPNWLEDMLGVRLPGGDGAYSPIGFNAPSDLGRDLGGRTAPTLASGYADRTPQQAAYARPEDEPASLVRPSDFQLPSYTPQTPAPEPAGGLLGGLGSAADAYLGTGNAMNRAMSAQHIGTGNTPDMDQPSTDEMRQRIMATPYQPPRQAGVGASLSNPAPGTVSYDPEAGDVYGGHASATALALASLIPLTSNENLAKRVQIYAADLGVPMDRFFTDDQQNVKYVDMNGDVFSVSPSIEGGTWRAPFDLARRVVGTATSEAGQIGTQVAGAIGGTMGGWGPAAKLAGGMAGAAIGSAAFDIARQVSGNMAAQRAGYRPPDGSGAGRLGSEITNIDWLNVGGQALQNASFEGFARTIPSLLNGVVPAGLFGANVFRLNRQEMADLAYILEYDAKTSGHILRRAQAMDELNIPMTPTDLLQVADGLGMPAGYAEALGRLHKSFDQLEVTLANRTGGAGAGAAHWMQNYYRKRAHALFPQGVENLLNKISPAESTSIKEGFTRFQTAANDILAQLEQGPIHAGLAAGWDDLFKMRTLPANTAPVRDYLKAELKGAAGEVEEQLRAVLNQLEAPATYQLKSTTQRGVIPVTDYQKLHNVRLQLRKTIHGIDHPGKAAMDAGTLDKLRDVEDLLASQLRNNPLYEAGDNAFREAASSLEDARGGLISMLRDNPLWQEKLGASLATAGPTKIAAAKRLFERFDMMDVWNAHTRAYLETGINAAMERGTNNLGSDFFATVAGSPKLRAGLKEMAPDKRTGQLIEELVFAGKAMDARMAGGQLPLGTRVNTRRMTTKNNRDDSIIESTTNPLGYGLKRALSAAPLRDAIRETRSMKAAVAATMPAGSVYSNMRHTSLPLAGPTGEALERAAYAAAPFINDYTNWIPRMTPNFTGVGPGVVPSPEWLAKLGIPYLTAPAQLDPTAPDIRPHQRAIEGLLGPAPQ
jgi:hypothetical protein